MTSERHSAIVIFDDPQPETAKRIGERFLVADEGTVVLSPRIPRAIWYRIGGTRG